MKSRNQFVEQDAVVSERYPANCIARDTLHTMKLHSKPRCAWCNNTLIFLYGEFSTGSMSMRCSNCKKISMIDIERNQTLKIVSA